MYLISLGAGILAGILYGFLDGLAKAAHGAAEFTPLGPPPLPVLPEWSPVQKVSGHYRKAAPTARSLAHQCRGACGVHAHAHERARRSNMPLSDFSGFWGALGCSCFAF